MSLPWFRFYHEVKDDPKMGSLTDMEFRVFVEALCWACESGLDGCTGLTEDTVNWAFRRNVTVTVLGLLQKQLLTRRADGFICVTNWVKRQMASDSSTPRVQKYRKKLKNLNISENETLQKRSSNGIDKRRVDKNRGEERSGVSPSVQAIQRERALTRCEARLAIIKGKFPLPADDPRMAEFAELKNERKKIMSELGLKA